MRTRILKTGLLLAVMATGIFLRFYRLDNQSLWWDEGYSWCLAKDFEEVGFKAFLPTYQGHTQALSTDKTQPLFHILVSFLPDSWSPEWKMRFWSALAGSLSLLLFWGLLTHFKLSYFTKIFGLFIVSTSPFLIFYAQEGRPYSLLLMNTLLFLLSVIYFHDYHNSTGKIWITISVLLIGYTQFIALIVPFSYAMLAVYKGGKDYLFSLRWARILVINIFLLFPAFYLVALHREAPLVSQGISIMNYLYGLFTFIVGFSFGPSTNELHIDRSISMIYSYWPFIVAAGMVGAVLSINGLRTLRKNTKLVPVLFLGVLSTTVMTVLYFTRLNSLYPRHLIVLYPFVILLLINGLHKIKSSVLTKLTLSLFIFITGYSILNYFSNSQYYKEDSRAVAGYITRHEKDDDRIMVCVKPPFQIYYKGDAQIIQTPYEYGKFENTIRELSQKHRLWVIMSRPWEFDTDGKKLKFLETAEKIEFNGGVILFKIGIMS